MDQEAKERRWGRRRWAQHSMDKINYWLAKSYLNMGQIEKAKTYWKISSPNRMMVFLLLALQNVEHLKKLKWIVRTFTASCNGAIK